MSRPKTIHAYPTWLIKLLSGFEGDRKPRLLYFHTVREARAFQLELSGFRGAVRAEGSETLWPNCLAMRTRRVKADDTGIIVHMFHADDDPGPRIEQSPY